MRSPLFQTFCLSIAVTGLAALPAHADAVPAALRNKTVAVSFSLSDGAGSVSIQRQIMISSAGKITVRSFRSTGSVSDSPSQPSGNYRFSGGRIVGVFTMADHANQLTVTFDPGFQSCSANLAFGKTAGRAYRTTSPAGVTTVSNNAPRVSGLSCSIRDGTT